MLKTYSEVFFVNTWNIWWVFLQPCFELCKLYGQKTILANYKTMKSYFFRCGYKISLGVKVCKKENPLIHDNKKKSIVCFYERLGSR